MSKHSEQMRHLVTSPTAMMKYQASGKLPNAVQPQSPLITLLESLSPRDRIALRGVRLSPDLGYECLHRFNNAEAMLRYLKPKPWMVGSWPAESFRNKRFQKVLTLDDFHRAQNR